MKDLKAAISECGWTPTVIISGTARGADTLGEAWAKENGVPCEQYPADWKRYGRAAGLRRNESMADNAAALVALWDGSSSGTKHMINIARKKGLLVYVKLVEDSSN